MCWGGMHGRWGVRGGGHTWQDAHPTHPIDFLTICNITNYVVKQSFMYFFPNVCILNSLIINRMILAMIPKYFLCHGIRDKNMRSVGDQSNGLKYQ